MAEITMIQINAIPVDNAEGPLFSGIRSLSKRGGGEGESADMIHILSEELPVGHPTPLRMKQIRRGLCEVLLQTAADLKNQRTCDLPCLGFFLAPVAAAVHVGIDFDGGPRALRRPVARLGGKGFLGPHHDC